MKVLRFITKILTVALIATTLPSCEPKPVDNNNFTIEIGVSSENPVTGESINFFLKPNGITLKELQTAQWAAQWNFDDSNATANSLVAYHTYENAGVYHISVQVTGKNGVSISAEKTLIIESSSSFSLSNSLRHFDTSYCWIMAHRCNADDGSNIPENSIAALNHCIELSYLGVLEIVEIDPRMTSDGFMVIMHDATVNRTTNGTGTVAEMSLAQIKQLRLKLPDGTVTDEQVPTLEEFLTVAKDKIFVNFDYYEKVSTQSVYDLTKKFGMLDQTMFSTGNHSDAINFLFAANPQGIVYSNVSNANNINDHAAKGIFVTHITNSSILTTALVGTAVSKGLVTVSELLNQNGITIDNEIKYQNSYSGVDAFVATGLNILQTDQAPKVHAYLKVKGKRK